MAGTDDSNVITPSVSPAPPQHADRLAEAARQHSLGRLAQRTGLIEQALEAYGLSLQLGGADPERLADMSCALSDAGLFEAAASAARIAIQMRPGCSVAHNNLGYALLNLNCSGEAIRAYDAALRQDARNVSARFGRALALLKSGQFRRGWSEYEWRRRRNGTLRTRADLKMPEWTGGSLRGHTIIVHGEQGLGDVIQFARFVPRLAAAGARVVLDVPKPLVRLLYGIEGAWQVVATGSALPPASLHCPIGSLPNLLRIDPDRLSPAPYLPRPPIGQTALALRSKVLGSGAARAADAAFVVGLVWSGDPRPGDPAANLIDRRRSTSLASFAPLFDIPGLRVLSFQLGEARKQIASSPMPITDAMEGVDDFADTAARLQAADLLISVDTSMAHLAGAMGFPVWMASRSDACWRWGEHRADTPWYPSMRIFRQPAPGDWPSLIAEIRQALEPLTAVPAIAA